MLLYNDVYFIIYRMYFSLSQYNNIFVRPEKSKLLLAVPLCARTVIFFCEDFTFYHYSLIESKILYQSKLPGRIVQAISLSGHEILCTIIQSRALMLLNIKQKSFEQICRLPQTKIHNDSKQKEIFAQTRLYLFQSSNKFYIEQPRVEQNKTKIYFYNISCEDNHKIKPQDFITKQVNTRKMILRKLDTESRLVLFKQEIQDNGIFKFSTIDCNKDFLTLEYQCENKAFTRFAIVREIREISKQEDNSQMLIFVNCNGPEILIFSNNQIREFPYKSHKIFLSTILINIQFGYGIFMFMPDPDQVNANNANHEVLQLINFKTASVLDRRKIVLHQVVKSWEDDYILLYKKETTETNSSPFQTENIIGKNAYYMKMLWEKGFSDFSQDFMKEIIMCFE